MTKVHFSWVKKGKPNGERLFDRLIYHDLYLLADMMGGPVLAATDVVVENRGMWGCSFKCMYGGAEIHFHYDLRGTTVAAKKIEVNVGNKALLANFSPNPTQAFF